MLPMNSEPTINLEMFLFQGRGGHIFIHGSAPTRWHESIRHLQLIMVCKPRQEIATFSSNINLKMDGIRKTGSTCELELAEASVQQAALRKHVEG